MTVDGVTRAAEYGDVAILLRTAGRTGDVFQRALTQRGIPVSSAPGSEFFASPEITAVVNLLSVIDNPRRDIPLLATLRSLCFGFTADDLAFVRAADRNTDLYSALCMRSEDSEKCAAFLEKLGALREAAPELSCEEIVRRVIGEFDLLAAAGALEDGERHRANLLELIRIAGKFESSGYRGLHRFVQWLRRLAEKGSGGAGETAPSGVKILSIHKSKGLEFPIVFLCDLGHPVNLSDASDRVLVHPVLGLGAKVTDLERRVEYPTLARKAIAHRIRRETLSEEMRLLYVAMTRAKEYLIMTASDYAPEKLLEKARKRSGFALDPEALAAARSMLGWVMAAIEADGGEHLKLRIVGKEDEADQKNAHAETAEPDGVFLARLRRNLSFVYPYADAVGMPSKITATELKDRAETDEEAKSVAPHHAHSFRRPRLSGEKETLTAARKGTVTHLALQHLDLDLVRKGIPVGTEVGRLHREGFLTADEASAVDTAAIEALFASPLGKRILAADKVRREFRFSLLCDAEELLGMPCGEKILLQGIVDCLLEEDGGLTVIDYKTDAVHTEEEIAERTALYTPQLQTYAMASSRIFSLPVKACRLYFLAAARTVDIVPRA